MRDGVIFRHYILGKKNRETFKTPVNKKTVYLVGK